MLTPKEVLANRKQYVQDLAENLAALYSQNLSQQTPDKSGCYQVSAPSCPPLTDEEKEAVWKSLEQKFSSSGWNCRRTGLIFSFALTPKE